MIKFMNSLFLPINQRVLISNLFRFSERHVGISDRTLVLVWFKKMGAGEDGRVCSAQLRHGWKWVQVLSGRKIFSISINTDADEDKLELLNTIAHELTHVRQCETGKLKKCSFFGALWEGRPVSQIIDMMQTRCPEKKYELYLSFPWEVEAREVAESIVELYKRGQR